MNKIKPTADRILIEPIEDKYKGSIIIPDEKDKIPEQGKIMAKGKNISDAFDVDDTVLFLKYGPNEVEIKEIVKGRQVKKKYLVAKEEDILAVLE